MRVNSGSGNDRNEKENYIMTKLTKFQRNSLNQVLYHAQRAEKYIMSDRTVVAHRSAGTTTLDYTRSDGKALYEVEKVIGSDLCGLQDAIRHLSAFLGASL